MLLQRYSFIVSRVLWKPIQNRFEVQHHTTVPGYLEIGDTLIARGSLRWDVQNVEFSTNVACKLDLKDPESKPGFWNLRIASLFSMYTYFLGALLVFFWLEKNTE